MHHIRAECENVSFFYFLEVGVIFEIFRDAPSNEKGFIDRSMPYSDPPMIRTLFRHKYESKLYSETKPAYYEKRK